MTMAQIYKGLGLHPPASVFCSHAWVTTDLKSGMAGQVCRKQTELRILLFCFLDKNQHIKHIP